MLAVENSDISIACDAHTDLVEIPAAASAATNFVYFFSLPVRTVSVGRQLVAEWMVSVGRLLRLLHPYLIPSLISPTCGIS